MKKRLSYLQAGTGGLSTDPGIDPENEAECLLGRERKGKGALCVTAKGQGSAGAPDHGGLRYVWAAAEG